MSEKIYKLGYFNAIVYYYSQETINWLKDIAKDCEKLILGIPSDYVMTRLYGSGQNGYSAERVKAVWEDYKFIKQVIILDEHEFGYQTMYEKLHFDACFYGTEYGFSFIEDKAFFKKHNVAFIPLHPQGYSSCGGIDSLELSLKNVQPRQKIVLFGTGKYFDLFITLYGKNHTIAYAIDNNSEKWLTFKDGIIIKAPTELRNEDPENILVIICSKKYNEIVSQLKKFGSFNYRSMLFTNNISLLEEMYLCLKTEALYLKQAHEKLKILLKEFDRVCTKYGLRYYFICGSLIGVIRHNGFIPWDDDIDLAMTREDYNKLREVTKEEWKNSMFTILHYDSLGHNVFWDFMPRVVDLEGNYPIKVFNSIHGKINPKYEGKLFLDIYPMDNASDNDIKHNFIMALMRIVYVLCMGHRGFLDYSDYSRLPKWKVKIIKILNKIGSLLPFKFLIRTYEKLSQYAKKEKCQNYFMSSCSITCIERKFNKKFFEIPHRVPFEDIECSIPIDYDGLLNAMWYRNYMNYPPLLYRKPSHYFNSDLTIW